MSSVNDYLLVLFLAGALLWQLISGKALGVWWRPSITRQDDPRTYWFVLAVQGAILVAVMITGTRTWDLRQPRPSDVKASSLPRP